MPGMRFPCKGHAKKISSVTLVTPDCGIDFELINGEIARWENPEVRTQPADQ